jgi:two-component system response regulator QseB
MKVLIVEDDIRIALPLKEELEHRNYLVQLSHDGEDALKKAISGDFDLIILDVMLPVIDGMTVCRRLRQNGCESAIIMVSARGKSSNKINGLDCGADDYLTKPFELDELTARIRAVMRRGGGSKLPEIALGDLLLDLKSCVTTYRGQPVDLTPTEYRLLAHFLTNPGRTYSKNELISKLWTADDIFNYDIIKTHIKGLRNKLAAAGAPRDIIETVYGLGYRLKSNV